jgi:class 3 adenylate cyclase
VIEVELPTGTVTLLFTDIEGSTRLLRSLGDDYRKVLGRTGRSCGRRRGAGKTRLDLAGAALGCDVLAAAADEVAAGRAMTVVQGLDYAVGWADQRGRGPT